MKREEEQGEGVPGGALASILHPAGPRSGAAAAGPGAGRRCGTTGSGPTRPPPGPRGCGHGPAPGPRTDGPPNSARQTEDMGQADMGLCPRTNPPGPPASPRGLTAGVNIDNKPAPRGQTAPFEPAPLEALNSGL